MKKITRKYRKRRNETKKRTKMKKHYIRSQKGGIKIPFISGGIKIPFISGGNPESKPKFEIPLENMNIEQLCLKAGFVKDSVNSKNEKSVEETQKNIQKNINSTKELGGKLDASMNALIGGRITDKVVQFGNAMTWFPRKIANAAMNAVGIESNGNNSNYNSNSNSNSNIKNMSNIIDLDNGICSDHQDKIFNNCNNPNQFIEIYNKSVKKLKNMSKIHFDKNIVDQINNIQYITKNT